MGIVIINGKKYDSVTGLMINDQGSAHTASIPDPVIAQTANNTMPEWIASYVDKVSATRQVADTQAHSHANTDNADNAEHSVVEPSTRLVNKISVDVAPTRTVAQSARRNVTASNTLNRRFVKKPLSESGDYAESLAQQQLRLRQEAKQAVAPIDIPEKAQLDAADMANKDFVPILTKRQAEGLNRLSNQPSLSERVAKAEKQRQEQRTSDNITVKVKPAVRLAPAQTADNYDDDVLNERLSQLSQILQNAQDVDAEMTGRKSAKRSRNKQKTAHARSHRKFQMPAIFATAGAMAIVAGIGFYIAMPSISVKMAANKAGIDAKTPYTPAGFTIDGEVAYQTGRITINYRSKSGGDGYSVTQEKSDASNAQGETSVYSNNYQTMQAGDTTVYRYRDMVTWTDDGMRYTINTNDYLDSDDITNIVNSL